MNQLKAEVAIGVGEKDNINGQKLPAQKVEEDDLMKRLQNL